MNKALTLIVLVLLFAGVPPIPAMAQVPVAGKEAPLFALSDLEGKRQSLADQRGRVVLVVFWATWCPSCVAELPALDRLHKTFREKGFSVLAISVDEYPKKVRDYIEKKGLTVPVLVDVEKEVSFDLYAVTALPAAFLIDRNGVIAERLVGEINWDEAAVRARITGLLDGREKSR